jgi:hypothetical protein
MARIAAVQTSFVGYAGLYHNDALNSGVFTYSVLTDKTAAVLEHGYVLAHCQNVLEMSHVYVADSYIPFGSFSPMRDNSKVYLPCPPMDDITLDF